MSQLIKGPSVATDSRDKLARDAQKALKQGKIAAKLLPTEVRLRNACTCEVPQSQRYCISKARYLECFWAKSSPEKKKKAKETVVVC